MLAFGAVYPWAYWPLCGAAFFAGATALWAAHRTTAKHDVPALGIGLLSLGVAAAIGVQLIPLDVTTLDRLSPMTSVSLLRLDLRFAVAAQVHPLSLLPSATVAGLVEFCAAMVLLIGTARLCSAVGVRWLATSLLWLGVLVSLIGIIQKPLFTGKVYGFWQPAGNGNVFGPFVNRNHFAGWMMMVLPTTLGLLSAGIDRGMQGVKPVWRERLLWLGSQAASRLTMTVTSAVVMALALVLTFSRSGIAAFGLAVFMSALVFVIGGRTQIRKAVVVVFMAALFILVFWWVGPERISSQFKQANWGEFNDRRGAWADAQHIASLFPLTGTGFGTYAIATVLYQEHDLAQHYEQAHNDYLEILAEGGALIAVPAAALVAWLLVRVAVRVRERGGSLTSQWVRIGALTGLLAIALQEVVDFSLQMPGNAMLCAVLIGIALHKSPRT